MRLGFYYHVPAIHKDGVIYMPGYLGRFIDSLAEYCQSVTCFLHAPRPSEIALLDYPISAPNVSLVDIGPHDSIIQRTLFAKRYTYHLRQNRDKLDLILLRGPSPLLPAMASSAGAVPVALLLVGDYLPGVDDLPQPRWRKEAIRLWARWNKWRQTRVARNSLTFVNSRVLYDELKSTLPNLYEIHTTTLTEDDFYFRPDTCQSSPPYRLLYVGRMDRGKGLLHMVDAVALLNERGQEVELDLVGWPELGDPILDELQNLADSKKIQDKVHYLGSRPLGPELFECYKKADIYIIASLASEGFPRTIWEAMAHSLPVVATRVGSIPAFIEGAAELVMPMQSTALADAIEHLIHNPELRRMYIVRGVELARKNTLDMQVGEMIRTMQSWLGSRHG